MSHQPWTRNLDAYLDGELESSEMEKLDQHLRECPECAAESVRRLQWKRAVHTAGRRYTADSDFRQRVQRKIARGDGWRLSWRWWPAFTAPVVVLLLLAAAALVQHNTRQARNSQIIGELVDLHVSTLASASPVDVISSDRHTVKPWFEGKIPFTFNLPELQGTSFELIGGRVSYLQQSPGAELIFRVRKHQISVFIFQDQVVPSDFAESGGLDARSFHLETFERNGLRYFVLGDAGLDDLRALSDLLRNAK